MLFQDTDREGRFPCAGVNRIKFQGSRTALQSRISASLILLEAPPNVKLNLTPQPPSAQGQSQIIR